MKRYASSFISDPSITADFTTLQLSADYRMKKTPLRVSWRNVNGDGDMSGADSRRSTLTINAKYLFDFDLSLTGRVGFNSYDDRSEENLDYDETYFGFGLEQRF